MTMLDRFPWSYLLFVLCTVAVLFWPVTGMANGGPPLFFHLDMVDQSEPMTVDEQTSGRMYRPVYYLSLQLDLLHGASPFGVNLLNVVLHLGAVAAVFFLAYVLFGNRAGVLASLLFGLSPAVMRVVPFATRRGDSLAVLFSCLAIGFLALSLRDEGFWWYGWFFVALAAAFFSKETALVLAPVALAMVMLSKPSADWLRYLWPVAGVLGIYWLMRYVVLPTPQGTVSWPLVPVSRMFSFVGEFAGYIVWPLDLMPGVMEGFRSVMATPTVGLCIVAITVMYLLYRVDAGSMESHEVYEAILVVWIMGVVGIHLVVGNVFPWYAYYAMAPFAVFVSCCSYGKPLVAISALIAVFILLTPVFVDYGSLEQSKDLQKELSESISSSETGKRFLLLNAPVPSPEEGGEGAIRGYVGGTGWFEPSFREFVDLHQPEADVSGSMILSGVYTRVDGSYRSVLCRRDGDIYLRTAGGYETVFTEEKVLEDSRMDGFDGGETKKLNGFGEGDVLLLVSKPDAFDVQRISYGDVDDMQYCSAAEWFD